MSWWLGRRILSFGLIGLGLLIFILGYLYPAMRFYYDYDLNTFDYAILYEGVMRFVYGESTFMSSRGVYALADNQEWLQFLWSWIFLFSNAHLALLISQSLIFLAAPVAMSASFFRKNDLVFALLGIAFLVHPVPYRMAIDIVHSEAFNFVLVPLLILSIFKNQALVSLLISFLICLVKEDSCLYLTFFWMVYSVFHWHEWKSKPWLMATRILIPITIFGFNYLVVLPHFLKATCEMMGLPFDSHNVRPANHWFDEFMLAQDKVTYFLEKLIEEKSLRYYGLSFWPVFLYRRKYLWIAVAASGQVLLNILSRAEYLTSQAYHYDHFIFPAIWMGLFLSFYQSRNYFWTTFRAFVVLGISIGLSLTVSFFNFPRIWHQVKRGVTLEENQAVSEIRKLSDEIQEANLSADYLTVPYLMKPKRFVSMFPNTLVSHVYGVENCDHNPVLPELVVLKINFQSPEYLEYLQRYGYTPDPRFANYQNFVVWKRP